MTNHKIVIEINVEYRDNKGEKETNYEDENKIHYKDLKIIDLEDNYFEITYNDILLLFP